MNRIFKKDEIFTIPNLLSIFRLALIPVIIWLYWSKQDFYAATAVVILSGATDVIDGFIARRFNMVSDFGKILDPIADKLTQGVLIICLSFKYPLMIPLVILFVSKEFIMASLGAITIKKQDSVNSAKWHGKINTIVLYCVMIVMILFPDLPKIAVNSMIALCTLSMLTSLILYTKFYITILKKHNGSESRGDNHDKVSCRN